eukprot:29935-Pelagococcus_subviridis.AAC.2
MSSNAVRIKFEPSRPSLLIPRIQRRLTRLDVANLAMELLQALREMVDGVLAVLVRALRLRGG